LTVPGAAGSVVAIVLAAGLSSRMGRSKALLDWFGEPLVLYQVRQLREAGAATVIVVTGHAAAEVEAALAGSDAVVARNEAFLEGRAGSIRSGAAAVPPGVETIVLLNVDQPRRSEVVRRLIGEHLAAGCAITVPAFAGRRGHPALLAGRLLIELAAVSEAEQGLKEIMRRHAGERHEVEFSTDEVLLDLNTPGAYEAVLTRWMVS
jgi:molybdenum cofactor cytidylyltransferase